ncbi:DUF2189 domain-containing protein [Vibrio sp. SM6]|uniref:DUF2189 domain-containing protein n=1 Tax=Vibrio agarilyticus TaxID=2726741 RepID=A0A7X8TQQ8_9VIBR|nr:DUF2189 domain-containing protein [Vibrio agarilyticus]NLS12872.1 DUF2189 domain-containing protein [Vibrio agarilyticus]
MPRSIQSNNFEKEKLPKNAPVTSEYARTIKCHRVEAYEPINWLILGCRDFFAMPIISGFYGLCFMAAAVAIVLLIQWQGTHLVIMPALIIFMLIGPFLALGLYDASWACEKGHQPSLLHSMRAIGRNSVSQWAFAVLLAVAMMFWMRIGALLHALYPSVTGAPWQDFLPFLLIGSAVGIVLATIVFAISAFSIPLMMERRVDMMTAVFTSVNAVRSNLLAMALWAAIIGLGVLIGFATFGVGMLITIPILGYGTWHAYRNVISRRHH